MNTAKQLFIVLFLLPSPSTGSPFFICSYFATVHFISFIFWKWPSHPLPQFPRVELPFGLFLSLPTAFLLAFEIGNKNQYPAALLPKGSLLRPPAIHSIVHFSLSAPRKKEIYIIYLYVYGKERKKCKIHSNRVFPFFSSPFFS